MEDNGNAGFCFACSHNMGPSAAVNLAKSNCMFFRDPFKESLAKDRLTTHFIRLYESCHGESVIKGSLNEAHVNVNPALTGENLLK